jgi:hypothetical protein
LEIEVSPLPFITFRPDENVVSNMHENKRPNNFGEPGVRKMQAKLGPTPLLRLRVWLSNSANP